MGWEIGGCKSLLLTNLIETGEFCSGYGIVHQGNFQVGWEGFNQTEVNAIAASHPLLPDQFWTA